MDADLENILAAWRWAVGQGDVERLDRAADALWLYCQWRARFSEGERAFSAAVQRFAGSPEDCCITAKLMACQSPFAYWRRRTEGLDLLREAGDLIGSCPSTAETARCQAFVELAQAERFSHAAPEEGKHLAERSMVASRVRGDAWSLARAATALGQAVSRLGACHIGVIYFREALAIFEHLGDSRGTVDVLGQLSHSVEALEEGEQLLREGAAICQKTGDRLSLMNMRHWLARNLDWQGQYEEARESHYAALHLVEALGYASALCWVGPYLAINAIQRGEYQEAEDMLERVRPAAARWLGDLNDRDSGRGNQLLSMLDMAESRYEQAERELAVLAAHKDPWVSRDLSPPTTFSLWSVALLEMRKLAEARQRISQALAAAERERVPALAHEVLGYAACVLTAEGRPEQSVDTYSLAMTHPRVANSRFQQKLCAPYIARASESLSQKELTAARELGRARDLWETVAALRQEWGDVSGPLVQG